MPKPKTQAQLKAHILHIGLAVVSKILNRCLMQCNMQQPGLISTTEWQLFFFFKYGCHSQFKSMNGSIIYLCGASCHAYPSHKAHRDQRRGCTAEDPPPAFCWLPNHRAPAQAERRFQSPPGAGLSSPFCQRQKAEHMVSIY